MVVGSNPAVPTKFLSSLLACIEAVCSGNIVVLRLLGSNACSLLDRAADFLRVGYRTITQIIGMFIHRPLLGELERREFLSTEVAFLSERHNQPKRCFDHLATNLL